MIISDAGGSAYAARSAGIKKIRAQDAPKENPACQDSFFFYGTFYLYGRKVHRRDVLRSPALYNLHKFYGKKLTNFRSLGIVISYEKTEYGNW